MSSIAVETPVLRLVVELEPSNYATREREIPDTEDISGWSAYFSDSLADAGLVGVRPLQPKSWLVDAEGLDASALAAVVSVHLPEPETLEAGDLGDLPPLAGGFALYDGDSLLVEPTCCADAGDLDGWVEAVDSGAEWAMLWIGHPWLEARALDGEKLALRETAEYPSPEPLRQFVLSRAAVERAITGARSQQKALAAQIAVVGRGLAGVANLDVEQLGRALAGFRS